jgi:hypothetical protein
MVHIRHLNDKAERGMCVSIEGHTGSSGEDDTQRNKLDMVWIRRSRKLRSEELRNLYPSLVFIAQLHGTGDGEFCLLSTDVSEEPVASIFRVEE